METRTNGRHSPDGTLWWSGSQWLPAWTPDRRWWFDGDTWTRVGRVPRPTALEFVIAGSWFLLWVLSLVWNGASVPAASAGKDLSPAVVADGLALGVSWFVLLPVCGYLLARPGRRIYVGVLIVYVWALLVAWYVAAMLMVTPAAGDADSDTAAGAGVAMLGIPGLLIIGALVGVGAGTRAIVRAVSRRRATNRS